MRLSSKSRYAVMAMMDLALHEQHGPVTLTDISVSQGISLSYLEQLFSRLRKSGLVQGMRGPGGGYRLAKDASEITMADIVAAVDEQPRPAPSWRPKGGSGMSEPYLTHQLWREVSGRLFQHLEEMTLAEFTDREEIRDTAERQDHLYRWGWNGRKTAA
ncbi:MAG: Rrf2 family transcriptional regulator [Gammaproteobacteria bacterium]|nr:Rrf2 family transcriptional regulator [Gammaproteobacteria bacterium]MCB1736834.1 Rrf2 family transcriptional regulator [Gammaproteobacteria bacterium]MCP5136509.1 Rrf2 family transcriptional regulator [Gammaproteobacteria bacterium]